MSRVLARSLFKKKAPKRSAKGVGITSMLEDDVTGYAEGGEVNDDRTERERLAQMLLDQGRQEYQRFSEGERPQMTRLPATMGVMPQPNPQQMQAAQMQQMAQMGMLPRFQDGGIVEAPSLWSRIGSTLGFGGAETSAMNAPEMRFRPAPVVEPQVEPDSLAARLAARRSAEQQRMAAEQEAIRLRNQAQTDVFRSPEGQEAMDLMTQGRILNDPALYQRGRDALKTLTDKSYEARGAETGPLLPFGTTPVSEPPEYAPSPSMGSPAGDTGGIMGGIIKAAPRQTKRGDRLPGGKNTDIDDIKLEREAKAAERRALADAGRKENMWLALMQAGLAIAGGRSPNAITNIGQGGQAGLASFMALEQQRRRDEDAAMRRDIAEREYNLQERRFKAMEPVYAAQAMAPQLRAQVAAAQLAATQRRNAGNLQLQAIRDVYEDVQKNPMKYAGKDGKTDKLAVETEIALRQRQYAQTGAGPVQPSGGSGGTLGLDFGDWTPSTGE